MQTVRKPLKERSVYVLFEFSAIENSHQIGNSATKNRALKTNQKIVAHMWPIYFG